MKLDMTEAQAKEVAHQNRTATYDTIFALYNNTTSDDVLMDADWCVREFEVERSALLAAMTYRRKQDQVGAPTSPTPGQKGSVRSAKAAIRRNPELAESLLDDPEVSVELENRIARRKEAEAAVGELTEPIKKTLKAIAAIGVADTIRQCAEDVRNGRFDEDEWNDLGAAMDELILARTEAGWKREDAPK